MFLYDPCHFTCWQCLIRITFVRSLAYSLRNLKQFCVFPLNKKADYLVADLQIAFIVLFDRKCIVKALIILLLSFELILSLILFYMMPIFQTFKVQIEVIIPIFVLRTRIYIVLLETFCELLFWVPLFRQNKSRFIFWRSNRIRAVSTIAVLL